MEIPAFDLTWITQPIEECLTGEGPIEGRRAELRLEGPDPVIYEAVLGYCSASRRWYGLLETLFDMLEEEGWAPGEVDGFLLNGTPVRTGLYLDPQQGFVAWSDFHERAAQFAQTEDKPPPPADEVRALEQRSTIWEIAWAPVTWVGPSEEEIQLLYAALVHDSAGHIRALTMHEGTPPDADALDELIRRAAGAPSSPGTPIRPSILRVADSESAPVLRDVAATFDIRLETAPTPQAENALADLTDHLMPDLPPPFLIEAPDEEVRAFFEAAESFFKTEPWTRFEGHKYLGVQFADGPWHYANVMGQIEESPGIAVFDDWLHVCRLHHNQPSFFDHVLSEMEGRSAYSSSLEIAGAAEAVTLDPIAMIHPKDAAYLYELGIEPIEQHLYPLPHRFMARNGEPVQAAPTVSLDKYAALMDAIRIALDRRRATPVTSIKTTLDVHGHGVSLRYPSYGQERPLDGPAGAQLVIKGKDTEYDSPVLPAGLNLHVKTPGDALFEDVAKALREVDEEFQYVGVGCGEVVLWDDRGPRKTPCPRVADLADCRTLWMEMMFDDYEVDFIPQDPPPESIEVELVEA